MRASFARQRALTLIVVLGVVSLLGDVTYEGARSIAGPYLALLGASAAVVGLVAGAGELFGYAFRTVAGYLADRLRSYWLFTLLGYASLLAIPALALAHHWAVAAVLLTVERLGKGLRTPARDAILSHATARVGRGFGFGLHEAMDQVGALIGPLLFTLALAVEGDRGYRFGFVLLSIPAVLATLLLAVAWRREPHTAWLEEGTTRALPPTARDGLAKGFRRYALFSALAIGGLAPFPLIAYHLGQTHVVAAQWIPLLYALAMGVDGLVAVGAGLAYDRAGLASLVLVPLLTAGALALVFTVSVGLVVAGVVLWGVVMGLVETNMRAAVGDLSPAEARGLAYGVFNSVFGLAWFVGGALMGVLYQFGVPWVLAFVAAVEIAALVSFLPLVRHTGRRPTASW